MRSSKKGLSILSPFKITLFYLVVAVLWILLSDFILEKGITDLEMLSRIQTYKGLFYVIMTSAILYVLIKKYANQLIYRERELREVRSEQESGQELIDRLFERIPVLITIYDPDLKEFEVNREFEKVTGWSNEEAAEIDLFKACYPDLEQREEVIEFMNRPGIGWKEFTITTKGGDTIETSWTNIRLTDDTSVGIGIDMTEIKASEAKLRESRELLKNTFESLEESVILVDPETRKILDCNPATKNIFGYSKEELVGSSTKILHLNKECYNDFEEMGREALRETGTFQTEFKMRKKNGEPFHSDHTVTLVYDKEGEVSRVVSVVRDISDRKEAEVGLKKSEEKYRFIFERNPQPMWVVDPETMEFIDVNEEAIKHYGYRRDELSFMKVADINPEIDESELYEMMKDSLYKHETIHKTKDGTRINVEVSAASIQRDGERLRIILANDITEKKRAKENIISSVIEGEDRERKRFARELHDGIGQYLSAANMNLEAVKKDIKQLSEKRNVQFSKGLNLLKHSISELRHISHNIMPKAIEDYGLVTALEALVENFENTADISFNFDHSLQDDLLEEQKQVNIYRIVQEIVNNAVKYAECKNISIQLYQKKDMIYLTIEDDGKGSNFYEDESKKGFGLKSIRSRTKALSGSIMFDSVPDKGTVITLWVPLKSNHSQI